MGAHKESGQEPNRTTIRAVIALIADQPAMGTRPAMGHCPSWAWTYLPRAGFRPRWRSSSPRAVTAWFVLHLKDIS